MCAGFAYCATALSLDTVGTLPRHRTDGTETLRQCRLRGGQVEVEPAGRAVPGAQRQLAQGRRIQPGDGDGAARADVGAEATAGTAVRVDAVGQRLDADDGMRAETRAGIAAGAVMRVDAGCVETQKARCGARQEAPRGHEVHPCGVGACGEFGSRFRRRRQDPAEEAAAPDRGCSVSRPTLAPFRQPRPRRQFQHLEALELAIAQQVLDLTEVSVDADALAASTARAVVTAKDELTHPRSVELKERAYPEDVQTGHEPRARIGGVVIGDGAVTGSERQAPVLDLKACWPEGCIDRALGADCGADAAAVATIHSDPEPLVVDDPSTGRAALDAGAAACDRGLTVHAARCADRRQPQFRGAEPIARGSSPGHHPGAAPGA